VCIMSYRVDWSAIKPSNQDLQKPLNATLRTRLCRGPLVSRLGVKLYVDAQLAVDGVDVVVGT
jgi:hypothetical protein